MRIACVAGFFNPVKTSIEKQLSKLLEERSVIWIPQIGNGQLNINLLKQAIFDSVGNGAEEILILLFLLRGTEYILEIVNQFIAEAKSRSASTVITLNASFKNAQDGKTVIQAITAFGPKPRQKQYPSELTGLDAWISENHSSTLLLHPRAKSNLTGARYEDVALVYAAVEILAIEYNAMKKSLPTNSEKNRLACSGRFAAIGVELAPSVSASAAGQEGDEYDVYYPPGQLNTKRRLELHLKKGSDRDERYCLRIYFFWDEDAKKVVIGWLPNHLDTRTT